MRRLAASVAPPWLVPRSRARRLAGTTGAYRQPGASIASAAASRRQTLAAPSSSASAVGGASRPRRPWPWTGACSTRCPASARRVRAGARSGQAAQLVGRPHPRRERRGDRLRSRWLRCASDGDDLVVVSVSSSAPGRRQRRDLRILRAGLRPDPPASRRVASPGRREVDMIARSDVHVGTCAGGATTYHVRLAGGRLVSASPRARHARARRHGEAQAMTARRRAGARQPTVSGPRPVRAPRGPELTCRGWEQEAALRMLMNNLDPEVAEDPDHLVVYGGTGRAARSWDAFDAIVRELRALADDETLLDPVRQARRRPAHPHLGAAGAHRQLEPRRQVGHLGGLPRPRAARADDVRPDDRGLVDLHRDPGHPAGHLRDLRGGGPPALRRHAARDGHADGRARRDGRRAAAGRDDERRRRDRHRGRRGARPPATRDRLRRPADVTTRPRRSPGRATPPPRRRP